MTLVMKSIRMALHWFGIVALGWSIGGCASKREVAAPVAATVIPAGPERAGAGRALVYVYRPKKRQGWSSPCPIRDAGAEIGRLRAGEYFSYEAAAGEHSFTATSDGSRQKRIELAPKQTYYLRVDEEEEFYVTPPHLTVVDPGRAPSGIEHLTRVAAAAQ
jgi:hypothetical protein